MKPLEEMNGIELESEWLRQMRVIGTEVRYDLARLGQILVATDRDSFHWLANCAVYGENYFHGDRIAREEFEPIGAEGGVTLITNQSREAVLEKLRRLNVREPLDFSRLNVFTMSPGNDPVDLAKLPVGSTVLIDSIDFVSGDLKQTAKEKDANIIVRGDHYEIDYDLVIESAHDEGMIFFHSRSLAGAVEL